MKHKTAFLILLALLGWSLNGVLPARAQERELALEKILNPLPEFDPFEKPSAAPLFFPDEVDKRTREALVDALTNRKDSLESHLRFFKDEDGRQQHAHQARRDEEPAPRLGCRETTMGRHSAGQPDAASALFKRTLAIDPGNDRARHGLDGIEADKRHAVALGGARQALERKDFDDAEAQLHRILTEEPA